MGAYVLASALRATRGDHHAAFHRCESAMRNFVAQNQKIAAEGSKMLIPKTPTGLWLRNQSFRLLPHLSKLPGLPRNLERAANAIDLDDHT